MSVVQGFKSIFFGEDEMEQEEYQTIYGNKQNHETEPVMTSSVKEQSQETQAKFELVLSRPKTFAEVKTIGSEINAKKTVILNLETVKSDDANRILDFISGVAFANDAVIKMTAQKTYAIMPSTVGFVGEDLMNDLENNGYSF